MHNTSKIDPEGWKALKLADRIDNAFVYKKHVYVRFGKWYAVYPIPNQWSRRLGLRPIKIERFNNVFPSSASFIWWTGKNLRVVTLTGTLSTSYYLSVTTSKDGLIEKAEIGETSTKEFISPVGMLGWWRDRNFFFLDGGSVLKNTWDVTGRKFGKGALLSNSPDFPGLEPPFSNGVDAGVNIEGRAYLFSGIFQSVHTGKFGESGGFTETGVAFWVPRERLGKASGSWRECRKCGSLADEASGKGHCVAGGAHEYQGDLKQLFYNNAYLKGDFHWRRCEHCLALASPAGKCVTGGPHLFSNNGTYTLPKPTLPINQEENWCKCIKCASLVNFADSSAVGDHSTTSNREKSSLVCPTGGLHEPGERYGIETRQEDVWRQVLTVNEVEKFDNFEADKDKAAAFKEISRLFAAENEGWRIRDCYLPGASISPQDVFNWLNDCERPQVIPEDSWNEVVKQLHLEIRFVQPVAHFFTRLNTALTIDTLLNNINLNEIDHLLDAETPPVEPPELDALSFILGFFGAILGFIPGEGEAMKMVIEATKLVVEVVEMSIEAGREEGEEVDFDGRDRFKVEVATLYGNLERNFLKVQGYLNKSEKTVMSDWGKIKAAHEAILATKGLPDFWMKEEKYRLKAYKAQILQTLMPTKYCILHFAGVDAPQKEIKRDKKWDFYSDFEHVIYAHSQPASGISMLVKKDLLIKHTGVVTNDKRNGLMIWEPLSSPKSLAIEQWFPSEGLMDQLTGKNNFGLNKGAMISGLAGWESIEYRKVFCGWEDGVKYIIWFGENREDESHWYAELM